MNTLDYFDLLLNNTMRRNSGFVPFTETKPNYPVNLFYNDAGLTFQIPIVGANLKDIRVVKTSDELNISHHRSDDLNDEAVIWIHRGVAKRGFDLKWKISPKFDLSQLKSTFQNGLLEITIPWSESAMPEEVEIFDLGRQLAENN